MERDEGQEVFYCDICNIQSKSQLPYGVIIKYNGEEKFIFKSVNGDSYICLRCCEAIRVFIDSRRMSEVGTITEFDE